MEPSKPGLGPAVGRRSVARRAAEIAAVAVGSIGFRQPPGGASAKPSDARNGRRHGNNGNSACVQHCRAHGADNCRQTCRRHVQPR